MQQRESKFFIVLDNIPKALEAIKNLVGKETIKDGGGPHFSWVNEFKDAPTLEKAMQAWRWNVERSDKGDITEIEFIGQKLGDDFILFKAIASFIESGSYIVMLGEDGTLWRWFFENGEVREQNARSIEWED
jgi:hypothetical protein